jgi:alpha-D-xyloside xylohydrolase
VIFSANAVINSWFIKNPPWDQVIRAKNNKNELMPEREQVNQAVRKLLQLRMQFIPYLYSAFNEYHRTGKPPIRALALDWPGDKNVRTNDDQFMFGDSVLVAPIFSDETQRQVYLPAGDWYDFWTHSKIAGGTTVTATNGVGEIPLFVKSGTLLPLAEPVEFVKPDTCFNVTVNVVGGKPADFTLYEDDGLTSGFAKGEQNRVVLHMDGDQHTVQRSGEYHAAERYKIAEWKGF